MFCSYSISNVLCTARGREEFFMSNTTVHTFPCICEHLMEIEVPEVVDIEEEPKVLEDLRKGNFLSVVCESCGKTLKPEFPFRVIHPSRGIDIYLLPERERNNFLSGSISVPKADRIAIGFPELLDKLEIFLNNLEDRPVELIKLYLLQKAGKENVKLFFHKKEDDYLVVHVHGLRPNEIGVSKVPLSVYEKAKNTILSGNLEKEIKEMLTPPYVSVSLLSPEEAEQ